MMAKTLAIYRSSFPLTILIAPVLSVTLRIVSPETTSLSYFVLAIYALMGRSAVVQALFTSWFITMLSPAIAPESSADAIGRYAVIAAAVLSILLRLNLLRGKLVIKRHTAATLVLGVFLVLHASIFSSLPEVSILKSVSFIIVFVALLSAWSGLNYMERRNTEIFVFGGMVLIVLFSVPFLMNDIGYLRNGTGFQGVLNHPQAFGPLAAILGAWLGGRFLRLKEFPLWQTFLLVICLVFVVESEARTAAGAFVLGLGLPFLYILFFGSAKLGTALPGVFTKRFVCAVWVVGIGLIAFGIVVFTQIDNFILKSGRSEGRNLTEAFWSSRGGLVEAMLDNIKTKPISGIGFGLSSDPDTMVVKRDPYLNLPISASVEKGVTPLAVVEELGVIGGICFAYYFTTLVRRSARSGFIALVVISAALATNLGESTLFSPNGFGMLLMVLVSWAATTAKQNIIGQRT